MSLLNAALLGFVQGLTEFLPISSSAHLIVSRAIFGWDTVQLGLAFDVACHVGTLLALVAYFRRESAALAAALPVAFRRNAGAAAWLLRLVLVGTVPVVLVGLFFGDDIEAGWRTPEVAAGALAGGAVLLLVAERIGARARTEDSLTMGESLLVGIAQATALIPGVSRSGVTIAAGVLLGLRRDAAARFAFLLGIPAVMGAAGREALVLGPQDLEWETLELFFVGLATSAAVGYVTVSYFIQYVTRHSLDLFAYYRLALAAAVVVWLMA